MIFFYIFSKLCSVVKIVYMIKQCKCVLLGKVIYITCEVKIISGIMYLFFILVEEGNCSLSCMFFNCCPINHPVTIDGEPLCLDLLLVEPLIIFKKLSCYLLKFNLMELSILG